MGPIVANFKWIMLVSGALTFTMVYAAIAPQAALLSTFGETLDGPLADVVVRNWGALVALIGVSLVYGAFVPAARPPILVIAGVSKAIFIVLVLAHGGRFLGGQAAVALALDAVWVVLFAWYLLARPRPAG